MKAKLAFKAAYAYELQRMYAWGRCARPHPAVHVIPWGGPLTPLVHTVPLTLHTPCIASRALGTTAMNDHKLAHARGNAAAWLLAIKEMLSALHAANASDRREEAQGAIRDNVLSVLVRDGWHEPTKEAEEGPEEYEILLSTGGPALRIWGQLNKYYEPESAQLQVQDWCIPWTPYPAREGMLLDFARQFWFGG